MNDDLIIGLTGRFGAGCTTTNLYLKVEENFKCFSLSKTLRKKAKREIKDLNGIKDCEKRKTLQDLGDELRKRSPAALAKPIIKQIKQNKLTNVVIDSIRNPAEVEAFKKAFSNFLLLAVDAETETRWQRLKHMYDNNREQFDIDEERDAGENQPDFGQQVKKCIELADILISNKESFYKTVKKKNIKTIEEYGQKISSYIQLMRAPGFRQPTADEIYMHHACSVALWSSCLKNQVGAVIVVERHSKSGSPDKKNEVKEKKKENKEEENRIKESYVVATGCNKIPIGENPCKDICHRDDIKENYKKTIKFCRNCGSKLPHKTFLCKKCNFDNLKLPGKLLDLCRAVHAEEAAILQAAKLGGTPLEGAKLYTSLFPCQLCCKKIINTGIKNVIYLESYPMEESLAIEMFRKCKINISKYEGVNSIAFNKLFKRYL